MCLWKKKGGCPSHTGASTEDICYILQTEILYNILATKHSSKSAGKYKFLLLIQINFQNKILECVNKIC